MTHKLEEKIKEDEERKIKLTDLEANNSFSFWYELPVPCSISMQGKWRTETNEIITIEKERIPCL